MVQVALTVEMAREIAGREIARRIRQSARLSRYKFEPVALSSESDKAWKFVSTSEGAIEAGYAPGALYVTVDKLDGHIWSDQELGRTAA